MSSHLIILMIFYLVDCVDFFGVGGGGLVFWNICDMDDAIDSCVMMTNLSLVLEHLELLIVCLDFGLQGGHYSLGHPELRLSEMFPRF